MQIFPRETTDYIAEQFYLYFHRRSLTVKEAKALIDFVQGSSVPSPSNLSAMDYSDPRVQGGKDKRPSERYIARIFERAEDRQGWDDVFNELIRRCQSEPEADRLVRLAFKERLNEDDICERMNIGRTTYYEYRIAILNRAAVLAYKKDLINY